MVPGNREKLEGLKTRLQAQDKQFDKLTRVAESMKPPTAQEVCTAVDDPFGDIPEGCLVDFSKSAKTEKHP